MVFSSVPVYLDPPNWQQQPNHHHQQQGGGRAENPQLPPPPPPPPGGGAGSIRPGSMADRARLAKIPQPEVALKCPRCESSNTKFCYFNNYSLTQPRHFCKTCRRYWTRGGALRNVPVGGGCRRNKRSSKSSRSKSPAPDRQNGSNSTSTTTVSSNSCNSTDMLGHHLANQPPTHLPFLPPLHHLNGYGGHGDIGLNFNGIEPQVGTTGGGGGGSDAQFHMGASGSNGGNMLPNGLAEQWRLHQQVHQFPNFLANLEPPSGLYPFESDQSVEPPSYLGGAGQLMRSKPMDSLVSGVTQLASVKMEGNQGLNLSRNFLGSLGNHEQYLGGGNNAWTGLSNFTSSTNHIL
ncbi:hypothetical protein UlMin_025670 [Ulmus minor]